MGADLIGHILVGPKTITVKRKGESKKFFTQLVARANELMKDENWDIDTFLGDMALARIYRHFIKGDKSQFDTFCSQLCELIDRRDSLPYDDPTGDVINKLIDKWVDWWNKPQGRDTMYREWGSKKIVVCGGTSYGDSPSDEFDEISDLIALGVLDVLGVT
jgi:hypothetical protein